MKPQHKFIKLRIVEGYSWTDVGKLFHIVSFRWYEGLQKLTKLYVFISN